MKLTDIKPNPDNPRVIRDEKFKRLCNSIQDFPKMMELRPIVIDSDNVVLGGNMRLRALGHLGYKDVPDSWVRRAEDLTEEEKKRFIITDNAGFGEWDYDMLANIWNADDLVQWGLDVPNFEIDPNDLGTDFTLPDGNKAPFQQMTFTFADEQAILVQNAISDIKQTQEYKYTETMGNENSNGNALYLIVSQWAEQRK
jgi:hypothetical protein